MSNLYSARGDYGPGQYRLTKFDRDYNPEVTYNTSRSECDCPAGARPTCKHRKMVELFLAAKHIDDGWFLDWDTRMWRRPLTEGGDSHGMTPGPGMAPTLADTELLGTRQPAPIPQLGRKASPPSPEAPTVELERPAPVGVSLPSPALALALAPKPAPSPTLKPFTLKRI